MGAQPTAPTKLSGAEKDVLILARFVRPTDDYKGIAALGARLGCPSCSDPRPLTEVDHPSRKRPPACVEAYIRTPAAQTIPTDHLLKGGKAIARKKSSERTNTSRRELS